MGEPFDPQDQAPQQSAESASRDALRLLEALPVPIFVVEDHRITFVNEAQARLFGVASTAEVIGSRIDKFAAADTRERLLRALDEIASEPGSSRSVTEKFVRVDGRALNIEYIIKSVAHGGRTSLEAVLRKVLVGDSAPAPAPAAPRRRWFGGRAERRKEIRRTTDVVPSAPPPPESVFIQALEALPEGIYSLDDTGVCRYINRAGAEALGYEPDEIVGKRFHDLAHYRKAGGDLISSDDCPLHTTRGSIEAKQIDRDVLWRWDGSSVPITASTAPLPGGGRVVAFRTTEDETQVVATREVERQISTAREQERRTSAEAVAAAVRRERVAAEERLREALEDERKRAAKSFSEERHEHDERIKDLEKRLRDATEQEKKRIARAVDEALDQERRASGDALKSGEKRLRETAEQERKKAAKALAEAVAAEKRAAEARLREVEERLREAVAQERSRVTAAVEEAVNAERRNVQSRVEQAVAQERAAREEAVAAAVATERAANKRALRDAVAAERSLAESAVRDAARVAAEKAVREAQDVSRNAYEQELRAAIDLERAEAEKTFNQRLAEQRAAFESILARERDESTRAVAEAITETQRVAEERARMAEERDRAMAALNEALAAERTRAEFEINAAVAEAREAAKRTMDEARVTVAREVEASIRAAAAKEKEAALAAERRAAQAAIASAVDAERAKFGAALKQMADDNRHAAAQAVRDAVDAARTTWERERGAAPGADPRFALLLDSLPQGVYALDLDGRFTHVNEAAAQMFGYEREKLIGQSAHETIHQKRRDGSPYPLQECPIHSGVRLGHMSSADDEIFWSRKGAPFPIDYSYAPIHQGSNVVGGVVTFKDITERKLVVQEAAQLDRMSSLGRFAAAATHEFDKVLQGIRAAAEVIRWHNSGEELEDAKAQLVRMLERGNHLTRQISRFTEPREADAKPIELVDWFQAFLQAARVALKENIELNFRLPDETLYVKADPGQLNQIFMNLVLNARDAMPNGGRLTMSIDSCLSGSTYSFGVLPTPDRFIHFVVEDTGVGIPTDLMSRIFEPLFTTKGSGTAGMGLAICHQLVRKLGGSIFVESTVGSGTQFHIFLPAAHPEIEETTAAQPARTATPAPPAKAKPVPEPPKRKRIIVISTEDFAVDQKRAAADAGVDIEVVYGGTEATELIQLNPPDALLMEISWMEADGVDVYRNIATRWPKLPIIVSTAKIHEVKVRGGILSLPNVRYLPYDIPTLVKWVEGPRK